MLKWISSKKPLPDVVVALNDLMAIGCINACRENHIDIPGEIGIVGFDDIESSKFLGLTTVRVPLIEMGARAAELAIEACNRENPARHVVIDTTLIIRSTCRDPNPNRRDIASGP
jgi:LacI family transcriptional regulator